MHRILPRVFIRNAEIEFKIKDIIIAEQANALESSEGIEGCADWQSIKSPIAQLVDNSAEELQKWKTYCQRSSFLILVSEKRFVEAGHILALMSETPKRTEALHLFTEKIKDHLKDIAIDTRCIYSSKDLEDLEVTIKKFGITGLVGRIRDAWIPVFHGEIKRVTEPKLKLDELGALLKKIKEHNLDGQHDLQESIVPIYIRSYTEESSASAGSTVDYLSYVIHRAAIQRISV